MSNRRSQPAALVRKQVLLTREQQARLKAVSVSTGRPETDIVRAALETWLGSHDAAEADWKAGIMSVAGLWQDHTSLDAIIEKRRMQRAQRRARLARKTAEPRRAS